MERRNSLKCALLGRRIDGPGPANVEAHTNNSSTFFAHIVPSVASQFIQISDMEVSLLSSQSLTQSDSVCNDSNAYMFYKMCAYACVIYIRLARSYATLWRNLQRSI